MGVGSTGFEDPIDILFDKGTVENEERMCKLTCSMIYQNFS